MEEIRLHKASRRFGRGIVVDQCRIFRLRGSELVVVLTGLVDEEVSRVLSNQDGISRVVDRLVWDTIDHLPSTQRWNV